METSSSRDSEMEKEEVQNKEAEEVDEVEETDEEDQEPKSNRMLKKKMIILTSLACGALAVLLWGILRFPRKFGITKIFKDKKCTQESSRCPHRWNRIYKNCFFLSEHEATWMDSQESCKIYYSSLAKFNFPKEMESLMQYLKPSTYWIGLNKLNENNTWEWVDGTPYRKWYNIEDNGNCVYIDRTVINSADCEKRKKFICSKKSFCA